MKKWLCAILVAALLCSSCLNACAEADAPEIVAAENAASEETVAAEGELIAEVDSIPDAEEAPEELEFFLGDVEAMANDVSEAETPEGEPAEDPAGAPAETPALPDYAAIAGEEGARVPVYRDAAMTEALLWLRAGDIVLAVAKDGGIMQVAFDSDRGEQRGYVPEDALAALEAGALEDALDALVRSEVPVACYEDDLDLLLPRLACEFPGETTESDDIPNQDETILPVEEADINDAPTGVSLNYSSLSIGLKETCRALVATVSPADAETTLTWSSSDSKIVRVDKNSGAIYGVAKGTATVAVSAGTVRATCKVKVADAPTRLTLKLGISMLYLGDQPYQLPKPTVGSAEACATFTCDSSDKAVATVTDSGLITPVGKGTTLITVQSYNGKKASFRLSVYGRAAGVRFETAELRLYAGQKIVPAASVVDRDGDATPGTATFFVASAQDESEDAECVSVSADGRTITGVKEGKARLYARSDGGIVSSEPCAVSVVLGPEHIALRRVNLSIGLRETRAALDYTLEPEKSAASVTWKSSNPKVVRVNAATGAMTGLKKGSAKITATTQNGKTATCAVRVVDAPKKVTLFTATGTLYNLGDRLQIQPRVNSGAASAFTYSGGGSVADVSADGLVTAKASGTATVTVRAYNGKTATFRLTVMAPVARVTLPERFTIAELQTAAIEATAYDAVDAVTKAKFSYTWEDGTGRITVDPATGAVQGLEDGEAIIRVSATSAHRTDAEVFTAECPVTVVKGPRAIAFGGTRTTIGVGEYIVTDPHLMDEDDVEVEGAYTVTCDKPNVASVSPTGVVRGKKVGTATITFTAFNGVKAMRKITVRSAPKKVTVSPGKAVMGIEQTMALKVSLSKGAAGAYTFTSTNPEVATVSAGGLVTALSTGTTKIIVQTYVRKVKAVASITVGPAPEYIRLTNVSSRIEEAGDGRYSTFYWKTIKVGETFQLKGAMEYPAQGSVTSYTSSDEAVATVNGVGMISAKQPGVTRITVTATGGAQAECTVYVLGSAPSEEQPSHTPTITPGDDGTRIRFTETALRLRTGTTRRPEILDQNDSTVVTGAQLESSDPAVATASGDTIRAVAPGEAIITATYRGASVTMLVSVYAPVTRVVLSPAECQGRVSDGGVQLNVTFGSGESGSVTFTSSDEGVATVDAKGYVTFVSPGKARITARSDTGRTAECKLVVREEPLRYRLFTAYSYDMNKYAGAGKLAFTRNNALGVYKVFMNSGLGYTSYANLQNPSKAALLSRLTAYVNGAGENDVSLIYLCTHGHSNDIANTQGYYLSLSPSSGKGTAYERVTSNELYSAISGGSGRVVLILDSCYSGCFINDVRDRLSVKGNISVLTAASNTRASFYNVANPNQAVDFFTFFLLLGTGYDARGHYYIQSDKYSRGSAPGYMLADSTRNVSAKDGVITVNELFDYAEKSVTANIPGYRNKSWYWGVGVQYPMYFAGNNGRLAIYKPK